MNKITISQIRAMFSVLISMFLLIIALTACGGDTPTQPPPPKATDYCNESQSLACKMVIERYKFLNNANQYGYFYGFMQGHADPVVLYVVKGSVFPVSDQVTPPDYQTQCDDNQSYACAVVLQKQQPDGTWGTNGNAMFGYTADGNYFEWLGAYAYSSQPLAFQAMKTMGCPQKTTIQGCA